MSDIVSVLASLPSFRDFTREELETVSAGLYVADYADGYRFTAQGKRAPRLYILLDGRIDVIRRGLVSDRERVVRTLGPGDLCGLQSLVDLMSERATSVARGPVRAASLTLQACDLLMAQSASLAFHFKLMVGNQLAQDLAERNRAIRAQLAEL